MQTQPLELFFWSLIAISLVATYMLPTLLAVGLHHERAGLITFFNVTLGWTGVAWFALLLWSIDTEYLYDLVTKGRPTVEPKEAIQS